MRLFAGSLQGWVMSSEIALSSICEIVMGQSPAGEACNKNGEGLPLLNGPTEFGSKHPKPVQYTTDPRKFAEPNDLLFCVRGSTGRMNWADQKYAIGRGLAAIRGKNGYPNSFVKAVLETKLEELLQWATGSTFPNVGKDMLGGLKIPNRTATAAAVVSSVIDPIDDRITLLRETNKTLEAIAQAIFKSWFIDFDPVRAKMEGRTPAGMDEETAALFPDELVESELGLVPKGWDARTVGDVIDAVGGATPDTKNLDYWEPAEHHWTSPKDLSGINDPVLLSTERRISSTGLSKIGSGLLPSGTLLMSSRAPIGYLAIADMPVAINQGYIAMPPSGQLSPLYMLRWCQANMEGIKGRANGSTFMEISKKAFRPIPILVPNPKLHDVFEETCGTLFDRLVLNSKQAKTLAEIRDALLPRLISGKLQALDSEKFVPQ